MSKRKYTTDWYKGEIPKSTPQCKVKILLAERSNGKSYWCKETAMYNYKNNGEQFIMFRWKRTQCTQAKAIQIFEDMQKLAVKLFGTTIVYDKMLHAFMLDSTEEIVGWLIDIERYEDYKNAQYPRVTSIIFEEFIHFGEPILDAVGKYVNMLSTIIRDRTDVNVYLVGNPVQKYNVLFEFYGVDVNKLEQGKAYIIEHKHGCKVVVDYCKTKISDEEEIKTGKKNLYYGVDNNSIVNMILYGEFTTYNFETVAIDGITWNAKNRHLIPVLFYGVGKYFEVSYKHDTESFLPIVFVRSINITTLANEKFRYVIADKHVQVRNRKGIIPLQTTMDASYLDAGTKEELNILMYAIKANRILANNIFDGNDFVSVVNNLL